jgi:two-component system CheB/CheR fusion protein
VVVRAVLDPQKSRLGTVIYAEDVSHQDLLRATAQELEATSEELYSLHKELQRTNGGLRSINKELQATNEELNSLNEAFGTANDDLETRKRELDEMNRRYAETLEHMLCPIVLVNNESKIVVWNAAAEKLFGVEANAVVGLQVQELPLSLSLLNALSRKIAGCC